MNEKLLLIFEGKKTEPQIFKSLKNTLFPDIQNFELYACHGADIYSLYNTLEKDEDLDIIEILREKNKARLSGISRNDIAFVYLFFDYDPQAGKRRDDIIPKMLKKFNNETENGKLFISYPMIEATKDSASENFLCDENRTILLDDSKKYKNIINKKLPALTNIKKYTKKLWQIVIKQNLQQASWILHNKDIMPDIDTAKQMSQVDIYDAEYNRYVKQQNRIAILSAYPFLSLNIFQKNSSKRIF